VARIRALHAGGTANPGVQVDIGEACLLLNQVVVYEGLTIGPDRSPRPTTQHDQVADADHDEEA
jgi:hypothetical protein